MAYGSGLPNMPFFFSFLAPTTVNWAFAGKMRLVFFSYSVVALLVLLELAISASSFTYVAVVSFFSDIVSSEASEASSLVIDTELRISLTFATPPFLF